MEVNDRVLTEKIRAEVIACLERNLGVGYSVDFLRDPDDRDVFYVKVYDVPESCYQEFRRNFTIALRSCATDGLLVIPSLVSHAETERCFPSKINTAISRIPRLSEYGVKIVEIKNDHQASYFCTGDFTGFVKVNPIRCQLRAECPSEEVRYEAA